MKKIVVLSFFLGILALVTLSSLSIGADSPIKQTSIVTLSAERVLRLETVINASRDEVWKAFATEAGLRGWLAPLVRLDWRVGGSMKTNYDSAANIDGAGTITNTIVNYLPGELITYKVNLTATFAPSVRAEDKNLQHIVQLVPLGKHETKLISSMVGWGAGADWDKAYDFFAKGNAWEFGKLRTYLESTK